MIIIELKKLLETISLCIQYKYLIEIVETSQMCANYLYKEYLISYLDVKNKLFKKELHKKYKYKRTLYTIPKSLGMK